MFRDLNIRFKLIAYMLLVSVPSLCVIGGIAYLDTESSATHTTYNHLTSVRESRAYLIESYFRQLRRQVETLAEERLVVDSMKALPTVFAQRDSSDRPVSASDGSAYGEAHERMDPYLRDFTARFGYRDLLLIDQESGVVMYSVAKHAEFATSLLTGPYQHTNLADVFARARSAAPEHRSRAWLVDFALYAPGQGMPAAFIACPIYDGDARLGVVALQISIEEIDRLMTGDGEWEAHGLGASGETYLLGSDFKLRSDSRFFLEDRAGFLAELGMDDERVALMMSLGTSILVQEVHTDAATRALAGESGTSIVRDYRDVEVLSSYAPLSIEDVDWAILSEIDASEAFAPQAQFARLLLIGGLLTLVLIVCLALVFARSFMIPIQRLIDGAQRFGRGEERATVEVSSADEFGELTRVFNTMVTSLADKNARIEGQVQEHQRLLLSILPPSVAEHLRNSALGERLEQGYRPRSDEQRKAAAFGAYAPMDRRQAAAVHEELERRMEGTLLFADISGFTKLTAALTESLGTRGGAEELTRHLNRVYGALISEVHYHRGSVIGFSGDAITCWFDRDDGFRAVECGLKMQQMMNWFCAIEIPTGEAMPLALKVAITRGEVWRLLAGDPHVQVIDVVAGATVDRVAVAEGLAKQGEVVVGPQVVASLGHRLQIRERRTPEGSTDQFALVSMVEGQSGAPPWPPLVPTRVPRPELRRWLLPPVYERLHTGRGQFLAEVRSATAMFVNFHGLDFEHDDSVGDKLDAYVRLVQYVVSASGGSLIQLTTGDKGCYLYAVFGAPTAHADNAERALAAAIALRAVPEQMRFIREIRIGICQGMMRTGAYGSEARRTYGVLGDETNMAARLMGKADDGQILVGQGIVDAVSGGFRFGSLGRVRVKGKDAPIAVFEVVERLERETSTDEAGSATPAGPAPERAALALSLEQCIEALQAARLFSSLPTPQFLSLARTVESVRVPVDERIFIKGDIDDSLYLVVNGRVRIHDGPWTFTELGDGEVFGVVGAVSSEPRCASAIAVEDCVLVRMDGPVFIDLMTENRELAHGIMRLSSQRLGNIMRDADEYARAGMPPPELPRASKATEFNTSAEHERRRITRDIDTLAPRERLTLKVASVVGPSMSVELLHDVYPEATERDLVATSVERLVTAGLLTARSGDGDSADGDVSYVFDNPVAQQVAYEQLLSVQRRHLHGRAADWYETRQSTQPTRFCLQIAHHGARAIQGIDHPGPAQIAQVVSALERAGEQCLGQGMHRAAGEHFDEALKLVEQLPRTPTRDVREMALRRFSSTASMTTHGCSAPQVQRNLRRALILGEALGDVRHRSWVTLGQLHLHISRADRRSARELAQVVAESAANSDSDADIATAVQVCLGLIKLLGGDHAGADALLIDAQKRREEQPSDGSRLSECCDAAVQIHASLGWNQWFLGRRDRSQAHVEQALALAEARDHSLSVVISLVHAALVAQLERRPPLVLTLANQVLEACEARDIGSWSGIGHGLRGWALACLPDHRDHSRAVSEVRTGIAAWRATGAYVLCPLMYGWLGEALGEGGRVDDGLDAVEQALTMSRQHLDCLYESELWRLKADLIGKRARLTGEQRRSVERRAPGLAGEDCLLKAMELARERGTTPLQLRAAVALGQLWREHGRTTQATSMLEESHDACAEGATPEDLQRARELMSLPAGDDAR